MQQQQKREIPRLHLTPSSEGNFGVGIKKDGRKYSVRFDRHRYFFPQEWKVFIGGIINKKHYFFFLTCLHTGARAMEVLHLKPKNFDFERGTVTFEVVKQRTAKKQFYSLGKSRTFFVSEKYLKEMKAHITKNTIPAESYLFMDSKKLPVDYSNLSHKEMRRFYRKNEDNYLQLFKRKLQAANIKDWRNFSLHNIRKTYANWMRLFDIRTEEICYRLGHDLATFMAHYGSSIIFLDIEKTEIRNIMGNVK
jgi:integrase